MNCELTRQDAKHTAFSDIHTDSFSKLLCPLVCVPWLHAVQVYPTVCRFSGCAGASISSNRKHIFFTLN